MATPRVFPARVFDIGGGRILPSPNQFYLTGEDRLRIVSVNAATSVRLTIACRTAPPDGSTVAQQFAHVPATDRSKRTDDYSIGEGSLLNVTVFASAGAPRMGETYVIVQLVRGAGAAAAVLGTILGGSVTTTQALGFPGSPIMSSLEGEPFVRMVSGTQPAAGASFTETCPTGARWELQRLFASLTTSAAAGIRDVEFRVVQGGIHTVLCRSRDTQGPSSTINYMWAPNLPFFPNAAGTLLQQPFPDRTIVNGGDFFYVSTTAGAAGDQWTAPTYVVREWLEVP